MKTTLLISLLILFQINFKYKPNNNLNYHFNYRLKYLCQVNEKDSIELVNYYINSDKNNFFALIREGKTKNIKQFYFRDQDILTCHSNFKGNENNPGNLQIPDSLTRKWSNIYYYKAKNYEIINLKDTLISGKNHARVVFRSRDLKKAKRKKFGYEIYIIDTSMKMKPMLSNPTSLNIWRENKNMPDGLIVEKHVYNYKQELSWSERLIETDSVNFNFLVQRN